MTSTRRAFVLAVLLALSWGYAGPAIAQSARMQPQEVVETWYNLVLALVRHTPTYSPPVASRSLAYLGVTTYEAAAEGTKDLRSLSGQLNGLKTVPHRQPGQSYDEAVVVQAAIAAAAKDLFSNTGPTGQRALAAMETKLRAAVTANQPDDVVARSEAYGQSVAAHILTWAKDDGGATIANMGFPYEYELTPGPSHWVPTSLISQQQVPLLPNWGKNRTFAMPDGATCPLPAPLVYSEEKTSEFYKQAREVYDTKQNSTEEQRTIARFWSDDPMLSPTPPGHWVSIALQVLEHQHVGLDKTVETLARLGVVQADAFIGCWNTKFQYDLVRPVTYIHRVIDAKWEPLLITPPFPEYPSGHSTQSAAAATVLTKLFGENFAFEDATRHGDGLAPRKFSSFWAAAKEAGVSRLYGGIHFRAAIEQGLAQGRCIGAYVNALQTRR